MDQQSIDKAAALLVQARRDMVPLNGLPQALKPTTIDEGHAIQDATSKGLGKLIGGFKAMAPPNQQPNRGIIYAETIHASPCDLPAKLVPQCGVEGEVAFVFRQNLPDRAVPYSRNEVAAVVDAFVAIEIVHSRFDIANPLSNLEKLADSIMNAGLVCAAPNPDWRSLNLATIAVTMTVNGQEIAGKNRGHPIGDPLGVAVELANMWRAKGGVRAGQLVTCGSYTGLDYLKPGDICAVTFEGLGSASVRFTIPN
jgi:2-keto-4-pentenoate hydratase